ncbi:hypothetical protein LCGC14_0750520 [marine sediment metagenome]|jgi:Cu(I)/Ag(I) efflux system periplasmic protein CusF|uniref:Copper-binding protein n=1 Tax=marine sediment metagenome TaxID=412755 RepID=A0A0F9SP40_9ZZZZ|nr:copper-binding protein [Methylophaga sp.]
MNKLLMCSFTIILSCTTTSILAQQNMNDHDMKNMTPKTETSEQKTVHIATGIVTKLDVSIKKVTLSHEPIESLNWPAMSMGFSVKDESLLNKLSVGKTVKFEFIKADNDYVITAVN